MKTFDKSPSKDCLKELGEAEFPTNSLEPIVTDLVDFYEHFVRSDAEAPAVIDSCAAPSIQNLHQSNLKKLGISEANRSWPHQLNEEILKELKDDLSAPAVQILSALKAKGPLDHWPQCDQNTQLYYLTEAVWSFVKKSDCYLILDLLEAKNLELVIGKIGEPLRIYLASLLKIDFWRIRLPKPDDLDHLWLAAMDMTCIAFKLAFSNGSMLQIPSLAGLMPRHISPVKDAIRTAFFEVSDIAKKEIDARLESEHIARMIQYASKTEHQEGIKELSPAQKTRVFMNALRARNDYGEPVFVEYVLSDHGRVVDKRVKYEPMIIFKKIDQQIVQKFFEDYRHLSVDEVLQVLDECVAYYCKMWNEGRLPNKEMFNAYNGRNIRWLCKHFYQIAEALEAHLLVKLRCCHPAG